MREIAYLDRDNTIDLLLKADGTAVDLASVTRMVLKEKDDAWSIDYDDYNAAFDWTTPSVTGKVILSLGDALSAKEVAENTYDALLIVYDNSNPDGIIWGSGFKLVIRDV